MQQHRGVRLLRSDKFRQHLRVPAGVQGRQRQLPRDGPHVYSNSRSASGRELPKLKKQILAGKVDQELAIQRERACLRALREYDVGQGSAQHVIDAIQRYNDITGRRTYYDAYLDVLTDAPWRSAHAAYATKAGINVILFRGSERNKRRGFHNLYVFRRRLDRELNARRSAV